MTGRASSEQAIGHLHDGVILTTATRILHVVGFCNKLGPLFVKPHWGNEI